MIRVSGVCWGNDRYVQKDGMIKESAFGEKWSEVWIWKIGLLLK
ncbi:hypothetical protein [Bacteroides acidifaciens]|nr:hypothetical protein [Bacteroides acidifaciens]